MMSIPAGSSSFDAIDHQMMARAVALARRGEGRVEPNPMVGCVLARKGRVIGEGYHHRFGGPHAEIEALQACHGDPRGATVYVSLEPCAHHGKTPPCTEALIAARVARVVVAVPDPHPLVSGRGLRQLRAAGVVVETGLLAHEAGEVLAPYFTRIRFHRPYVLAKWAQSLNRRLVTPPGQSRWISSEASRRLVHRLRARVDAILVGSGTVLTDDPMLTARDVRVRRLAERVVLDGRLRIPWKCHLVHTSREVPTLVITTAERSRSRKAERLRAGGVEVVAAPPSGGRLSLIECLRILARRDVTNLLVEGGPTVLTAFLEAGLVDEAFVFTAPILIGGQDAPGVVGGRGAKRLVRGTAPRCVDVRRIGTDILHHLRFS